jgi:hypothetical protein
MVQDPKTRAAIAEGTMKAKYPKAYDYLRFFKPVLMNRGSRAVQAVMAASAFYAMFAVGVETFAPFKVVWRRMGNVFRAALLSTVNDPYLGSKLLIPSDTTTLVPFDNEDEALFVLGLVNSVPSRAAIYSFSPPGRGLGAPSILKQLRIGHYREAERGLRAEIVRNAKTITRLLNSNQPVLTETKSHADALDGLAAQYWGLSAGELASCQEAVERQESTRPKGPLSMASNQDILNEMLDAANTGEE